MNGQLNEKLIKEIIPGIAHCLFEQSGTFKRQFSKLGIKAYDYDIQNNFGETDHVIDLFCEIEKAYSRHNSIFDTMAKDDIILAFFPCIYFCENNSMHFCGTSLDYLNKDMCTKIDIILNRAEKRHYFYKLILKLCSVCESRGLRLIIENPYSTQHYLYLNFPYKPGLIDLDRRKHGDAFSKPTQYFFINIEPHPFKSFVKPKTKLTIARAATSKKTGLCSESRSMIADEYAEIFIRDVILNLDGSPYTHQLTLNF